ncbi:hypothetical protein NMY22_g10844 [Coprinellus aureogranulatus]|nr:hypothetical protein NMY22_g10844 [Coprinellus aureogranulatus]
MNSPFHSHLGTNYAPSEDETPGILALVEKERRSARETDENLTSILLSAAVLIKQRESHLRTAKEYMTLLSPARRLPDDVLIAIFQTSLCHDNPRHREPVSTTHPSVVISHVCSAGARLQLQLLLYGLGSTSSCRSTRRHMMAWPVSGPHDFKAWLFFRSARYPLSVTLSAPKISGGHRTVGGYAALASCLSLLSDAASRWKDARFDISFAYQREHIPQALRPLLSLKAHDIPLLQTLQLTASLYPDPTEPHSDEQVISAETQLMRSTALQSLHLDGVCFQWSTLPVDWSALKELTFSSYSGHFRVTNGSNSTLGPREAFLLLKACHRLVTCDLNIESQTGQFAPSNSSALLPFLEYLTIRGFIPGIIFTSALTLPSLHTLHLAPPLQTDNDRSFPAWIQRFGGQLHTVSMSIAMVSPDGLRAILEHLVVVSDLSLDYWPHMFVDREGDWGNAGLDCLLTVHTEGGIDNAGNERPVLCPALRKLRLDMRGQPKANTEEGLLAMMVSRLARTFLSPTCSARNPLGLPDSARIPVEVPS